MATNETPEHLREGVRAGILASLRHDVEMRGGRTARLLAAAGLIGVVGALGITAVVGGHPFDHHPSWHIAVVSCVWAGLLVVTLSLMFLGVRTASLPLARAAAIAVLGLGIAGVCGATCPDPHFVHWWNSTGMGSSLSRTCGQVCSMLCFGLLSSLFTVFAATAVVLMRQGPLMRPALPATLFFVLIVPGIGLQSYGYQWTTLVGWLIGAMLGSYVGVAGAVRARRAWG